MVLFFKQQSWGFNLVKLCQIRFLKQDLVVKLLVWRKHAWRRLLREDRIERRKTVIPAVERRGGAGRRTAPYSYLYLIELSISVLGYVKWTSIEWRGIVICSSHIHLTNFRLKCSNHKIIQENTGRRQWYWFWWIKSSTLALNVSILMVSETALTLATVFFTPIISKLRKEKRKRK